MESSGPQVPAFCTPCRLLSTGTSVKVWRKGKFSEAREDTGFCVFGRGIGTFGGGIPCYYVSGNTFIMFGCPVLDLISMLKTS